MLLGPASLPHGVRTTPELLEGGEGWVGRGKPLLHSLQSGNGCASLL